MARSKCSKDLYKSFLQASSVRYSGKALSEVSPINLNLGWKWVSNLRRNRKVNHNVSLESLEIPDEGLKIHLRGYGWVTVFKFVAKNGRIDYITTNLENSTREQIEKIVKARCVYRGLSSRIKTNLWY